MGRRTSQFRSCAAFARSLSSGAIYVVAAALTHLNLDSARTFPARHHRCGTVADPARRRHCALVCECGSRSIRRSIAPARVSTRSPIRGALRACDRPSRLPLPRCATLHERLSAHGKAAPACMRRLNRILGLRRAAERRGDPSLSDSGLHAVGLPRPVRARTVARAAGPHMRGGSTPLGELDSAVGARGGPARQPGMGRAGTRRTTRVVAPKRLGHPLIADDGASAMTSGGAARERCCS